jgi:small basic protein
MWLPVVGLVLGIGIGLVFSMPVPARYVLYVAVILLAGLDAVISGVKSELEGTYSNKAFLLGLGASVVLSAALTLLGKRLGIELYYAPIAGLGAHMFLSLDAIRRRFR